jgi:hypothetical protein
MLCWLVEAIGGSMLLRWSTCHMPRSCPPTHTPQATPVPGRRCSAPWPRGWRCWAACWRRRWRCTPASSTARRAASRSCAWASCRCGGSTVWQSTWRAIFPCGGPAPAPSSCAQLECRLLSAHATRAHLQLCRADARGTAGASRSDTADSGVAHAQVDLAWRCHGGTAAGRQRVWRPHH